MTKHFIPPRARGLVRVRADASDPTALLNTLNTAFEAFKAENDDRIKALEKGREDVVTTEKLARINDDITALTKAVDEAKALMAAVQVGPGSTAPNPNALEHATAFDRYFRRGIEAGLAELQVKAGLTTQSDPDGGYLVPTETSSTIDRVLGTVSSMRQLASVMPIGTSEYKKLVNVGGASSGWVGEEEARPETNTPNLRELLFAVMEIYANPAATKTMLKDGIIDIASWLASEVNIEFAEQEGAAFISGDGSKKPRGLLSYTSVANSSYSWGNVGHVVTGAAAGFAATDPADALHDLFYALKQGYRNNASWLTSDAVMGTIRKFKDGQGNYLWVPPTGDMPGTFMGKPITTDDNMPALGANAFPLAFGDFKRAYLIVDRQGIEVLRDEYTNKPYVHFYTTKRVGGGVANFEAYKLLKCST